MSAAPLYQLIDFGGGKKLERIGRLIVERPHPGATSPPEGSPLWRSPDLVFRQDRWQILSPLAAKVLEGGFLPPNGGSQGGDGASVQKSEFHDGAWEVVAQKVRLGLKPTPAGQVGIFPEHWSHWDWFEEKWNRFPDPVSKPVRVLHLFGYTGATTLALAGMGYHVTHVDASKPTVQWARENAHRSGLSDKPIRWLVEDAAKFVAREVRRGNQYEAIILDPPSFGHGTKAERWEIQRDLYPLMENCWRILSAQRSFVLLCGHSADIRLRDIQHKLQDEFGKEATGGLKTHMASLTSASGRVLDCGYACRFEW